MSKITTYGTADDICIVVDKHDVKTVLSRNYNYMFNKHDGFFVRWGKTKQDDPDYSPFGPEILDIEVMTGSCGARCPWCYKDNAPEPGDVMDAETFVKVIDKFPKVLTQVALGITDIDQHLDLIPILEACRERGIVPNFTMTGIGRERVDMRKIVSLVGAIAVSVYPHTKQTGYDTIKELTDLGLKQVNIHAFLSRESLPFVKEVLHDRVTDSRLQGMNAVVFLSLKPKGRAAGRFHQVTQDDYAELVRTCLELEVPFGFDSCGAPRFESAVRGFSFLSDKQREQMLQCSESCESFGLFSSYVNVHGDYFPCSFAEGEGEWRDGVSVLGCQDFLKDVWRHPKVNEWRNKSLETRDCHGCRRCLVFEEVNA